MTVNYRPISMLPFFSKMFGKLMCARLDSYLKSNNILCTNQFVFQTDIWSQVAADGGCERDVVHRMNQWYIAFRALKNVLSNRGLGIKAKKCLYEGVIVPISLYRAEAWGMRSAERRRVKFFR